MLIDYCDAHVGNSPSINDLLAEMHKLGYSISRIVLRTHLDKLIRENRLVRRDGKLIVIGADWLSPEEVSSPPK